MLNQGGFGSNNINNNGFGFGFGNNNNNNNNNQGGFGGFGQQNNNNNGGFGGFVQQNNNNMNHFNFAPLKKQTMPILPACAAPIVPNNNISPSSIVLKQTYRTKRECFNLIVNSQNASGQFINVETFIEELQSFDYKGIDKVVIQTFFIIQLLEEQFKEFKTEWRLLVKKANEWLATQNNEIPDEILVKIENLVNSFSI